MNYVDKSDNHTHEQEDEGDPGLTDLHVITENNNSKPSTSDKVTKDLKAPHWNGERLFIYFVQRFITIFVKSQILDSTHKKSYLFQAVSSQQKKL